MTALNCINVTDGDIDGVRCDFDAIREGEFLMLRGPSGCGKTTLLNIIGTIDKLTNGSISR